MASLKIFLLLLLLPSLAAANFFDFAKTAAIVKSYEKGDFNTTKKLLLSLHKDTPLYHYNLANTYYKLGKYNKAIKEYKRAFGEGVDEHSRLHNLGNSYFRIKDYKSAVIAYSYALKLQEDPQTRYNLKLAKEALKKPKHQKEQAKKKHQEKKKKNSQKQSTKKQKEARKLTKKEIKALDELKKRLQQKEEIKKMLQKSFKEKKVPVIMYPLYQKRENSKEPW